MERGIYFDAWCKDEFCYHPSLPMRRVQMLEDLEKYHVKRRYPDVLNNGVHTGKEGF